MSNWQEDFTEVWEAVVQFADSVNQTVLEVVEEISETITTELELISTEVKEIQAEILPNGWWEDLLNSPEHLSNFLNDLPASGDEDWPVYYEPRQAASETFQPACVGCRNYNGTNFNGNFLVCGIHPYGWNGDSCPDWEQQP